MLCRIDAQTTKRSRCKVLHQDQSTYQSKFWLRMGSLLLETTLFTGCFKIALMALMRSTKGLKTARIIHQKMFGLLISITCKCSNEYRAASQISARETSSSICCSCSSKHIFLANQARPLLTVSPVRWLWIKCTLYKALDFRQTFAISLLSFLKVGPWENFNIKNWLNGLALIWEVATRLSCWDRLSISVLHRLPL